jgi:hypothetical protein
MSIRWWNLSEKFAVLRKILAHVKEDFTEAKSVLADSTKESREQFAETSRKLAEAKLKWTETKIELAKTRRLVSRIGLSLSNFLYQTARDILLDKLSPRVRQANHDWDTGLEKAKIGEMEEAIDLLTRATDTFRTVGSVEKTVQCSDDLFSLHIEVGQEAEASIVCASLIEFLNGRIFDRNLADGYKTIGEMFRSLGSWTKGTEYHYLARRMLEEDGHKNYALLLDFCIAKELRRREEYTEAIALLTSAIDSMKQEKTYQRYLGVFYVLLTRIYCDINEHDKATEIHELAKAWFSERGYDGTAALESSKFYDSMGDTEKAIASLHECMHYGGGHFLGDVCLRGNTGYQFSLGHDHYPRKENIECDPFRPHLTNTAGYPQYSALSREFGWYLPRGMT